jgi:hypothetical protein
VHACAEQNSVCSRNDAISGVQFGLIGYFSYEIRFEIGFEIEGQSLRCPSLFYATIKTNSSCVETLDTQGHLYTSGQF